MKQFTTSKPSTQEKYLILFYARYTQNVMYNENAQLHFGVEMCNANVIELLE